VICPFALTRYFLDVLKPLTCKPNIVNAVRKDVALRIIGKKVDTFMLFCGGPDQWAPHFHLEDLNALRCQGKIPSNIYTAYFDNLIHDFIVHPEMVLPVVDFCIKSIRARSAKEPSSRL